MKIFHCINTLDKSAGGPSRSLPTLCCGLQNDEFKNVIVAYNSLSPNTNLLDENAIEVRLVRTEVKFIDKINCSNYVASIDSCTNLVQLHNLWTLELHNVAKLCQRKNIPYIWSPRGALEPWSLSQKALKKKIALFFYQRYDLEKAVCIHATADMEAQHIRSLGFNNPIAVIPNSIEINNYPLKKWNIGERDKKRLLFLSRLHPKKGLLILFEAWKKLPENIRSQWELVIAGEGDAEYTFENIKKIIQTEYSGLQIELVGPQYGKDKIDILHSADLFILPTYSENFGMAIAEAMCCGIPVVTTTGTPWGVLKEKDIGWWITPSVDSIFSVLQEALSLPLELLEQKGTLSRDIILKTYSSEIVTGQFRKLYNWILDRSIVTPDFIYNK